MSSTPKVKIKITERQKKALVCLIDDELKRSTQTKAYLGDMFDKKFNIMFSYDNKALSQVLKKLNFIRG